MSLQPETLIGTRLGGRYDISAEIGHGRSGVVFKAIDVNLNRPVALKVIYESMEDETALHRFRREAMASGGLNHPNIVTVFDFGLSPDNYAFLALEFLNGRDLHTILDQEGKLPVGRVVRITSQICLALGHAHKRGVIHRDMKPSNVMLRDLEELEDFVKIVDFGIAKRFDMEEETIERLTLEGQLLGTPAYMSPEQCQSTGPLDARSDIYSLGCVLFRMLTGTTPMPGQSLLDVINGHMTRMPLMFSETTAEVPEELQKVILKSLNKKPEDRQQSMFELRLELNAAYAATLDSGARTFVPSGKQSNTSEQHVLTPQGSDSNAQYQLALQLETGAGVPVDKEGARKWMRAAADRGHKEAQYRIALDFFEQNDPYQGVKWLLLSAQQGFEPAQFKLAGCYQSGVGVTADLAEAIQWYQESARQGNREAENQLSICFQRCYDSGGDSEGMEAWLRGRAGSGDPIASLALAVYLSKRTDAAKHAVEIFQLLADAAQKGDTDAQLMLGKRLFAVGQPNEYKQACHWLSQAAHRGVPEAMLLLAVLQRNGWGTPPNSTAAMQTIEKLAELGYLDAQVLLGCSLMLGDGIARNLTRGIALLKAAANDSSFGQWKLGLCYKNGLGTARDMREAEKCFKLSAEGRFDQGLPWQFTMPTLRFEDVVATLQTLANVGNRQADYMLGICYEDGKGVPRDVNRAINFYTKAAQSGFAPATEAVNRLRGPARV